MMDTYANHADAQLQARWDALNRQLTLVRRLDSAGTKTDLDQLIQWLLDQLDEVEMQLSAAAFAV